MSKRTRVAVLIAGVVAASAAAFGGGWIARGDLTYPDCPTEDSCSIDYRGGEWHVEPDVP